MSNLIVVMGSINIDAWSMKVEKFDTQLWATKCQ